MSPRRTRRGTVRESTIDSSLNTTTKGSNTRRTNKSQNVKEPKDDSISFATSTNDLTTTSVTDVSVLTRKRRRKQEQAPDEQNTLLSVTLENLNVQSNTKNSGSKTPATRKQSKRRNTQKQDVTSLISEDESFNTDNKKTNKHVSYNKKNTVTQDEDLPKVVATKKIKLDKSTIKLQKRDNRTPERTTRSTTSYTKNSKQDITPKSSPINVSLTLHRSTKTPRKSPSNLGSPKTHSRNSFKLLNVPRKLSIADSPPSSEVSSNSLLQTNTSNIANKTSNKVNKTQEEKKSTLKPSKKKISKSPTVKVKRLSKSPKIMIKTPKSKKSNSKSPSRRASTSPVKSPNLLVVKSPSRKVSMSPVKSPDLLAVKSPSRRTSTSPVKSLDLLAVKSPVNKDKLIKSSTEKNIQSPNISDISIISNISPKVLSVSKSKRATSQSNSKRSPKISTLEKSKKSPNSSLLKKSPKKSPKSINPSLTVKSPLNSSKLNISSKSTKSLLNNSIFNLSSKSKKSFSNSLSSNASLKSKKSPFNLSNSKMPKIVLNLKSKKSSKAITSLKLKKSPNSSKSLKSKTPLKLKKSPLKTKVDKNAVKATIRKSIGSNTLSKSSFMSPRVVVSKLSTPQLNNVSLKNNLSILKTPITPDAEKFIKNSTPFALGKTLLNLKPTVTSTPREKTKRTLSTAISKKQLSQKNTSGTVKLNESKNLKTKASKQLKSHSSKGNKLLEDESEPSLNDSSLIHMSAVFDSDNSKGNSTFEITKNLSTSLKSDGNTSTKSSRSNRSASKKNNTSTEEKVSKDGTYEVENPKTPAFQKKSKKHKVDESGNNIKEEQQNKQSRVTFASPALGARSSGITRIGTPGHAIHQKRVSIINKITSQMKTPVKTPVNRRSTNPMSEGKSKKIIEARISSINRLSRPKSIVNSATKSVSKKTPVAKKLPNFAEIHQKNFAKMESLVDMKKRVEKRHVLNTGSSTKKPKQATGNTPRATDTANGAYNRFGFKLRKNDALNIISKKQSGNAESREQQRESVRKTLKGVRMNRRFELQMQSRMNKNS